MKHDPSDVATFIDGQWDYDDPAATEAVFREHEAQLLTQIARAQGLQRRLDEAEATLDRVESTLTDAMPLVRVRLRLERGRVLSSSKRRDESRPLFREAWELAKAGGYDFYEVDAAHMLGIVEPPGEALEWNERALVVAESSSDTRCRRWVGSLCNNIGWTYHGAGDFDKALHLFERALDARVEQGDVGPVRVARWCVARCLRSLERVDDALAAQQKLLAELEEAGEQDGYTHEEIAECLLALGRADEARPHFARAHEILSKDAWLVDQEPQRLARLAGLGSGG